MFISGSYSNVLGAIVFASILALTRLPYVGRLFNFFLNGPIKGAVIAKILGLFISSVGCFGGLWIYLQIFNMPLTGIELKTILLITLIYTINLTNHIFFFKTLDFNQIGETLKTNKLWKLSTMGVNNLPPEQQVKLKKTISKTVFSDTYIPEFLKLIFSFGILLFSIANLNLIPSNPLLPSLYQCIEYAFSFLSFTPFNADLFKGNSWLVITSIFKFIIFFWAVMFIASAPSLFEGGFKKEDEDLNSFFEPKIPQNNITVVTPEVPKEEITSLDENNINEQKN